MNIADFTPRVINECECYENGMFLIVKSHEGYYNAYKNGESVQKVIERQDPGLDKDGNNILIDIIGAKKYATKEEAAADCIGV